MAVSLLDKCDCVEKCMLVLNRYGVGFFNKSNQISYDEAWNKILTRKPETEKNVPGAFVGWDNTPRKGERGEIFVGDTPEKFEKYLTQQIIRAKNIYSKDMIFMYLRDEKLHNIVRNALQMQIQIVMEEAEFVESIRQAQQEPYRVRRIERQIRQLTAEKAHTQGIKEKLYGDYAEEILTREDFLNYNELYSKRIEEYDRKITELEAERQNLQTAPNAYPFLDVYRKYRKLEEITRPMVVELIEKIEVYEGNRVEITFRFHDEIADLLEELHQKQHEVSA